MPHGCRKIPTSGYLIAPAQTFDSAGGRSSSMSNLDLCACEVRCCANRQGRAFIAQPVVQLGQAVCRCPDSALHFCFSAIA
jgi:hypothetical protein